MHLSAGDSNKGPVRFTPETWIVRDFFDLPWPFEDGFFDFSLCMGTLEDIRDPIVIAKEIQRISKAEYISMPTRATESFPWIVNRHKMEDGLVGYFHHRWCVEIIDDALVFKAKCPLLYNNDKLIIREIGQHTLNFFWHSEFPVGEEYFGSVIEAEKDCVGFKKKHEAYLRSIKKGEFQVDLYNYWDTRLGENRILPRTTIFVLRGLIIILRV